MPTDAELDWMIPVSSAPARTPRSGSVKRRKSRLNSGTSRSTETAADMASMPNMRVAKPSRIMPVSFFLSFLRKRYRTIPITARIGVKVEGLNICTSRLLPSMPERLKIHAVTVVPILAPMMTPMDWRSVIKPELTKPTTITVVAEELWITAVTPSPASKPFSRLWVIFSSKGRRLLPARRSSACPIRLMPNRNRHSPPSKLSTLKIDIGIIPSQFFFYRYHDTGGRSNALSRVCKIHVKRR